MPTVGLLWYEGVECYVCGYAVPREQATVEHIRPKSKGGRDDVSNAHLSHRKCNNLRGDHMDEHDWAFLFTRWHWLYQPLWCVAPSIIPLVGGFDFTPVLD